VLLADKGLHLVGKIPPGRICGQDPKHIFRRMNSVIQRHGGLIDKYMGDAILAVFGVGANPEDHALRAVTCAIAMQIEMETVNAENRSHGFPEILIGIGVNSDMVSEGLLGSGLHSKYTTIGNGINLTSRIE
jgi:adenylate cyclase